MIYHRFTLREPKGSLNSLFIIKVRHLIVQDPIFIGTNQDSKKIKPKNNPLLLFTSGHRRCLMFVDITMKGILLEFIRREVE